MNVRKLRLGLSLVLSCLALAAGAAVAESPAACLGTRAGRPWNVGIVPQLPPREIVSAWSPVLKDVGRRSGQCLVLVVAPSIPAFERQLRTGQLDFAFMNPYHQVMAQRWRGFVPLVRDGQTQLEGILVVRRDSPLRRLSDLNGATVAFPAPNAFAASLLPRALLARDGIRINPSYVGTHSNVYRSVILGSSRAGGGVNITLQRERPEVRRRLRVLWRTPPFPAHPFSAAATVPAGVRLRVQAGFLALGRTPQGRQMLAKAQLPKVVKADDGRDYAPLTALGLERFVVAGGD
ncbi:phosphate/phosphite/phosphonate ABC transporter substrate-binding protein [Synechococcus sp. BA-132 BA5]|uniref:phosphate/phosphite/phosphonate ABC transporter substrate-binding protein n=1 Tax=Synechococcus sp. BA-132 BA5 TaxID=3110252 RepID=UPI002B1EE4B3|nr:phosphate/phosphite/phosphonate ABC transporter substrate-binding protein [Synechococcus sp. BA-132 BA5]MEA5417164.1 phosphate/phosphite/phosphonate ABC transporter substrate-binding protein [Synechococcus sp. BA-132 BA5]